MTVKTQKPIELHNTASASFDSDELAAAILWYAKKPVLGSKRVFMHGRYPGVSLHGEKIHIHRLLVMYWNQRELGEDDCVHHVDGNRLNACKTNLALIPKYEHQSMHNKGKTLSEAHRRKIAAANTKRTGIKMKKRAVVPLDELAECIGAGCSLSSMARRFGVDRSTLKARIHEHPHLLTQGA